MGQISNFANILKTRAEPMRNDVLGYFLENGSSSIPSGYSRLSDNAEVKMAVDTIANLVSNMTIHLMKNTDKGDVRVKNELSRKIDINPCKGMVRKTWMYSIIHTLLLEGDGNCVVYPELNERGYIENLIPLKPSNVSFIEDGNGYVVRYGSMTFKNDEILHFKINPDPRQLCKGRGYRVELRDIVSNLQQANSTKNAFMSDKWKPPIIVSVQEMAEELISEEGREKILNKYINETQGGRPWVIPSEMVKVDTIKPLTLQDLAINDAVNIDKRTVAAILKVPPYFVGAGDFNKEEFNNFINTTIVSIGQMIQQELTDKLLWSPDMYFRLNPRSLYSYDLKELSEVGQGMFVRSLMLGNEVRDWIGLEPLEGLDERIILENYIPAGMIGDQEKLNSKGGENDD